MQIDSVRLEGRELILTLPEVSSDVRQFIYKFKPGKFEIKKLVEKRTNSANSYAWVLCDKIAQAVGITKEQVYRRAVTEVGVYDQLHVGAEELDHFKRIWEGQGLGYQVQEVGRNPAYVIINAYYGSHSYNSREMARLIENLTQDAMALDIETKSEEEVRSLLESVV